MLVWLPCDLTWLQSMYVCVCVVYVCVEGAEPEKAKREGAGGR